MGDGLHQHRLARWQGRVEHASSAPSIFLNGIRSLGLSYATVRHKRLDKYFLRDDYSKSMAGSDLKLSHGLEKKEKHKDANSKVSGLYEV